MRKVHVRRVHAAFYGVFALWFALGILIVRAWGVVVYPTTIGILIMSGAVGGWCVAALLHLLYGFPAFWRGARLVDRYRFLFLVFAFLLHAGTTLSREAVYVVSGTPPAWVRIIGICSLVASALPFWLLISHPGYLFARLKRVWRRGPHARS